MNGRNGRNGGRPFLVSLVVSCMVGAIFLTTGMMLRDRPGRTDQTETRLAELETEMREMRALLRRAREDVADMRQDLDIAIESMRTLPAVDTALNLPGRPTENLLDSQDPVFGDLETRPEEFGPDAHRSGVFALARRLPCRRVAGDVICGVRVRNTGGAPALLRIDGVGANAVATPYRFFGRLEVSMSASGEYLQSGEAEVAPGDVLTARVRFGPASQRVQSVAQISLPVNGEVVSFNTIDLEVFETE